MTPLTVRPEVATKCLNLTATFEGHGDGSAAGDFDSAVLTWGPLGFNLRTGGLLGVLQRIDQLAPTLLEPAFADVVRLGREATIRFVRSFVLRRDDPKRIRPEWQLRFQSLYLEPAAQQAFREASQDYVRKAEAIARAFHFETERGFAFALDVAVQNGSVKARALPIWAHIKTRFASRDDHSAAAEWMRMKALAFAIAETVQPRWGKDVLARKLCIALGSGAVHGRKVHLQRDFGIRYTERWDADDAA